MTLKRYTEENSNFQLHFVVVVVVTQQQSTVVLAILVLALVNVTGHCLVTALQRAMHNSVHMAKVTTKNTL